MTSQGLRASESPGSPKRSASGPRACKPAVRVAVVVALALTACKGKQQPPPPAPERTDVDPRPAGSGSDLGSAAGAKLDATISWSTCDKALRAAPKAPAMRRVQTLLAACQPCGDWTTLLDWNTEGASVVEIEAAMVACKGFCNADAKQKFMGTVDRRGKSSRGPWKYLGEVCKAEVSAVPDNRYASATWFALDRIARAAAVHPELAPILDAIELPLPAISVSGFGYELAHSPVTAPDVGPLALTVTPREIRIAALSRGKLGKDGVATLTQGEPYPGALVKSATELDAVVAKLGEPISPASSISVFAPYGMPARRLLDLFAVTGERPRRAKAEWLTGDLRLAVAVDKGPPGWALAGTIPIALRAVAPKTAVRIELGANPDAAIAILKQRKADLDAEARRLHELDAKDTSTPPAPSALLTTPPLAIVVGKEATVEHLAKLLGAAVYFDVKSVALISARQ